MITGILFKNNKDYNFFEKDIFFFKKGGPFYLRVP